MSIASDFSETYNGVEAAIETSDSYMGLLSAVWRIQNIDREIHKDDRDVRYQNLRERERLFGRAGIKNQWLHRIGAYQREKSSAPSSAAPELPPRLSAAQRELDETLSPGMKFSFLDYLMSLGRMFCISDDITAARRTRDVRLAGVEDFLFDVALDCPVLAWTATSELFRADPEYFGGSWSSIHGEIVFDDERDYDRVLNVCRPIDNRLESATRSFFRGLRGRKPRLIAEAAQELRKAAYFLRGDTDFLVGEYNEYESFGLESFPDAMRLVVKNEAAIVGPHRVKVVLGPPRKETWVLELPVHEFWLVEQATPYTLAEYQHDPIAFIRKHFAEIHKSTASRWDLNKADLLQGLVLEMNLENYVRGLSDMAFAPFRTGHGAVRQNLLAAEVRMTQKLTELTERLPPDLSNKVVAHLIVELLVDVIVCQAVSVPDAIRLTLIEVMVEVLQAGLSKK